MNCVCCHAIQVLNIHILSRLFVPCFFLQPSYSKEGNNDRPRKVIAMVVKYTCCGRFSFRKEVLAYCLLWLYGKIYLQILNRYTY